MKSTPEASIRNAHMSDYPMLAAFDEFLGDRRLDLQAGRLIVADSRDGQAIGYCCIDPTDFLGWPLLSRLCVHPDNRGVGIGLSLVKAAQADPRYLRLFTSTELGNFAMQALLLRCGADPIGHADQLNLSEERECLYRLK